MLVNSYSSNKGHNPYFCLMQHSQEHKYGDALKVFEFGVNIKTWKEDEPFIVGKTIWRFPLLAIWRVAE